MIGGREPAGEKMGSLEAVRGLAALQVVLTHLGCAFYPYACLGPGGAGRENPRHAAWEAAMFETPAGFLVAGQFAVCLFFLLSGFVLSWKYLGSDAASDDSLRGAILKRYLRLGGLVAFSVLLAQALKSGGLMWNDRAASLCGSTWLGVLLAHPTSLESAVRCILFNLFSGSVAFNLPLWTIRVELWGSYLVYFTLLISRGSSLRWPLYAVLVFGFRGDLLQVFLIGMVLADLRRSCPRWSAGLERPLPWLVLGVSMVLLGGFPHYVPRDLLGDSVYAGWPDLPWVGGGWSFLGALAAFLLVLHCSPLRRALESRQLVFLGRISFALYVVHLPLICSAGCASYVALRSLGSGHAIGAFWGSAASLGAIFPVAILAQRWVDRPVVLLADRLALVFRSSVTGVRGAVDPARPGKMC